jgi:N-acetylglutamate synthase-like GNAT family acetyltransferase
LLEDYKNYYIYCVNKLPVATARARNYNNWTEIGKISTLPRYQGRGRAGQLILQMLTELETQGAEAAFSLSISEEMHKFFYSLGFKSIERNQLPELWQKNYNPARNSKAYVYYFK